MAAFHPWLAAMAMGLLGAFLTIALWNLFTEAMVPWWAFLFGGAAVIFQFGANAVDPLLESADRWNAVTLFAYVTLGLFVVCEWFSSWEIRPFRFLLWALVIVDVLRRAMAIPSHVRSGAEQIVVHLNQVTDPVKNALIIGAVLLTFLAACVKFVKSLVD